MKKSITIIALAILIIAALAGGYFIYSNSRFEYNPDNVSGNTTGNLNNGGRFCEYDGKIYFSNVTDKGSLYVMDSDCSNPKALNTDIVSSLNVYGNYIYYVKNNLSRDKIIMNDRGEMFGANRCDLNGKHIETLYNTKTGISSMYGNYLYYQYYSDTDGMSLHRIKIDNSEDKLLTQTPHNPACIYRGYMYFADPYKKNNIYSMNIDTGSINLVHPVNAYMVDTDGDYLYYIDMDRGYALMRYNVATRILEQLFKDPGAKVISYNRYGNKIFVVSEGGSNPGLYRINTDGSALEYVAAGNITNIHCTSRYSFFQFFEDKATLYRVNTLAPIAKVEAISIN